MTIAVSSAAAFLPDMTVLELSVIVALLSGGPLAPERICQPLGDWFARPVRPRDIQPCLARLEAKGWVAAGETGLRPTGAAQAPTLLLYAGVIRMIGAVEQDAASTWPRQLNDRGEGEEP